MFSETEEKIKKKERDFEILLGKLRQNLMKHGGLVEIWTDSGEIVYQKTYQAGCDENGKFGFCKDESVGNSFEMSVLEKEENEKRLTDYYKEGVLRRRKNPRD